VIAELIDGELAARGPGSARLPSNGIVKQNGGFINVYSEPGFGTCFTI
jgi:hypothetical protein